MELAYLGLFTKIFNWVMDKIFDPVFKFISDLLSTVLSWVFNEILAPILFPILAEVLEFAIDLYSTIYSVHLYAIFSGVLKIIDYLEIAFDVFIGRRDVTFNNGGEQITGSLLEVLVQHEMVSKVFWVLTLSGFGIAMLLTIFGTAKSAFDLDFENKRPVSKVLTAMMKCFIQLFTVPLFVYFMLILAVDILNVATNAISGNTPTTLGRIVFVTASLNASRTSGFNAADMNKLAPENRIQLGTSIEDTVRYPFYSTTSFVSGGKVYQPIDYIDLKKVNAAFNIADFDYLIGFLAAIFLLFIMAVCIITFVQRIFEIVLLYIVSPYFVSTMPLDDGERFGRWRDLFIGKCFTGYGSAIGMRLYLVVCQMVMGGSIQFTDAKLVSSIEIDYFMKLFFLLGGAWAVFKSGPMVTSLLSGAAGQQESMTQSAVGASIYGHTIGYAMTKGKGAVMSAFRGKGGAGALARDRQAKNSDPNQKFAGAKGDRMAKAGVNKASKANTWKKTTVSPGASRSKITIGANRKPYNQWKTGSKPTGERSGKFTIGANRAKNIDAPKIKPGRVAMSRDPKMMAAARAASNPWSMGVKPTTGDRSGIQIGANRISTVSSQDTAFKEKKNFSLGRMIQSTYDSNGNHKIRVMGFGVDRDSSGNTMAFKMPVAGLKVQRTDANQSMQLARLHIPGITRINSNVQGGKLHYSDISVLHGAVKYHHDESGSKYRVLGGIAQYRSDAEGSHVGVMGIHGHSYHDGTSGVDAGKLHIRGGNGNDTVSYGSHVSFTTKGDHMQSVKIGKLEYSRSGITVSESAKKPGGK